LRLEAFLVRLEGGLGLLEELSPGGGAGSLLDWTVDFLEYIPPLCAELSLYCILTSFVQRAP